MDGDAVSKGRLAVVLILAAVGVSFLVYSAAELKQAHVPYGMESAMAKQYASDIALEVTNDALQIFGGCGYIKGMEVERFYRDAKITTIYEGTNEIQRVVIASHILGKAAYHVAKVKREVEYCSHKDSHHKILPQRSTGQPGRHKCHQRPQQNGKCRVQKREGQHHNSQPYPEQQAVPHTTLCEKSADHPSRNQNENGE